MESEASGQDGIWSLVWVRPSRTNILARLKKVFKGVARAEPLVGFAERPQSSIRG
jgi:hypothetical protein